jgi:hypothetical protein
MQSEDIFLEYFLSSFATLSRDKIINVRMTLSEIISEHYKTCNGGGIFSYNKEIQTMIRHLQLDNRDVSEFVKEIDVE